MLATPKAVGCPFGFGQDHNRNNGLTRYVLSLNLIQDRTDKIQDRQTH